MGRVGVRSDGRTTNLFFMENAGITSDKAFGVIFVLSAYILCSFALRAT